jgi:hypothetical protein
MKFSTAGVEPGHKTSLGLKVRALERVGGREIGGIGIPCHIRAAAEVDRDAAGLIIAASAKVCGVDNRRAGRVDLGHKTVSASSVGALQLAV